jgi:hypothetical protein
VQNESHQLLSAVKGLLIGLFLALLAIKVSVWILPVAGIAYLVHVWRQVGRDRAAYDAHIADIEAQERYFKSTGRFDYYAMKHRGLLSRDLLL